MIRVCELILRFLSLNPAFSCILHETNVNYFRISWIAKWEASQVQYYRWNVFLGVLVYHPHEQLKSDNWSKRFSADVSAWMESRFLSATVIYPNTRWVLKLNSNLLHKLRSLAVYAHCHDCDCFSEWIRDFIVKFHFYFHFILKCFSSEFRDFLFNFFFTTHLLQA